MNFVAADWLKAIAFAATVKKSYVLLGYCHY